MGIRAAKLHGRPCNSPENQDYEGCLVVIQAPSDAPDFSLGLYGTVHHITRIEFLPGRQEQSACNRLAQTAASAIEAYWRTPASPIRFPTLLQGTPFQQRVWQAISTIPCGQTRSYGELAARLGTAPRALGQACGANPYPLLTPCHRVLAKDHKIGGFNHQASGLMRDIKIWLLHHEASI